jgi:hypothetical protein
MKKLLLILLLGSSMNAASTSGSFPTTQTVQVNGAALDIDFAIAWTCDDFPRNSAPGRIEVLDGNGQLVARLTVSCYRVGGVSLATIGAGTVTDVAPEVWLYCPNGTPADGSVTGIWHSTGLTPGLYTLRLWNYTTHDTLLHASTVWTSTQIRGLSEPGPTNQTPSVSWTSAPSNAASGQNYVVTAHGSDVDGNLTQVNVWKNSVPFAFGGGGNGSDADSGNNTSDAGPQTVTFIAQAVDAAGAISAVISHVVTIGAPAPVEYSLTVSAGSGGSASGGGTFTAGTTATVTATPDVTHEFSGWSGDAGGMANPLSILIDGNKSVQANFALKSFPLSTSAASGGSVSPGGSFPYGTTISVSANPDALHYFAGWSGDASGGAPTVTVLVDRAKFVQALFAPKATQSITFANPGGQAVGATLALNATSTSGLPVDFVLLSGPATLSGGSLTITGPGSVSVQAVQPGNGTTLPASPVAVSFNAAGPVIVRYRPAARTILQAKTGDTSAAYVIGNP